ncbi:MAG: hypothetical protein LBC73_03220 [Oscillospiraceae bacterium]|jgi:hypothetical protein|nr:hypothetical protein [Oscillospiraceae bacterium]
MICRKCNTENEGSTPFCTACGTELAVNYHQGNQIVDSRTMKQKFLTKKNSAKWTPLSSLSIIIWVTMFMLCILQIGYYPNVGNLGDYLDLGWHTTAINIPYLYAHTNIIPITLLVLGTLIGVLIGKIKLMIFPLILYSVYGISLYSIINYNITPFILLGATILFIFCTSRIVNTKNVAIACVCLGIIYFLFSCVYILLSLDYGYSYFFYFIVHFSNSSTLNNLLFFGGVAMLCLGCGSKHQDKLNNKVISNAI